MQRAFIVSGHGVDASFSSLAFCVANSSVHGQFGWTSIRCVLRGAAHAISSLPRALPVRCEHWPVDPHFIYTQSVEGRNTEMTARNHTSLIEVRGMRFLITDRPNDKNVAEFLEVSLWT